MQDAGAAAYIGRWQRSSVSPQAAALARDVIIKAGPQGQERAKNLPWAAGSPALICSGRLAAGEGLLMGVQLGGKVIWADLRAAAPPRELPGSSRRPPPCFPVI
jgi:hypothetical protein